MTPRFFVVVIVSDSGFDVGLQFVKYGLNHIVALTEAKKAALVVIAH